MSKSKRMAALLVSLAACAGVVSNVWADEPEPLRTVDFTVSGALSIDVFDRLPGGIRFWGDSDTQASRLDLAVNGSVRVLGEDSAPSLGTGRLANRGAGYVMESADGRTIDLGDLAFWFDGEQSGSVISARYDASKPIMRVSENGLVVRFVEGSPVELSGELVLDEQFAHEIGAPAAAGVVVGTVRVGIDDLFATRDSAHGDVSTHGVIGPDVIVGVINGINHYTSSTGFLDGGQLWHSYSVGTTSCNLGDQTLDWVDNTNQHPVIPQAMYRIENGRITQVGMSWLKHGFCALQLQDCAPCDPVGFGCEEALGIGCSDPYDPGLNGSQGNLGPRWQVNPFTGSFSYPFSTIGQTGGVLYKRLRVLRNDIDPAQHPGAVFVVAGTYVHPDDAAFGNGHNNESYRRISINPSTFSTSFGGSTTQRMKAAIFAWRDQGNGPDTPDFGVTNVSVTVPGEGLFYIAQKVTDLGNGQWHYEYAIQNMTSDRAGGSFSIPLPPGANVSNAGFHSPDYHSGEPYDNTDWTITVSGSEIKWQSPQTFAQNPNSNALRWATLYNFWFDSDMPPDTVDATLGLFKPGTPESVTKGLRGPSADCNGNNQADRLDILSGVSQDADGNGIPDECAPQGCPGDTDGDNDVDFEDINAVLISWSQTGPGLPGDLDGDEDVDFDDMNQVLQNWGASCA